MTESIPSATSLNAFAAKVTLPDFVESYNTILAESCAARSSDRVTFSTPVDTLYFADERVGAASSSYENAAFRGAALGLFQMSVTPPTSIATLLGWFRSSKPDFLLTA